MREVGDLIANLSEMPASAELAPGFAGLPGSQLEDSTFLSPWYAELTPRVGQGPGVVAVCPV